MNTLRPYTGLKTLTLTMVGSVQQPSGNASAQNDSKEQPQSRRSFATKMIARVFSRPLLRAALRSRQLCTSQPPQSGVPGGGRDVAKSIAAARKQKLEAIHNSQKSKKRSSFAGTAAMIVLGGGIASGCWFGFTETGNAWFRENVLSEKTSSGRVIKTGLGYLGDFFRPFTQPSREELLPDMPPIPPGHVPFRTLVLDLEGTLCHSEWDRKYGWRTAKRPGVDKFLYRLAGMYEIVLFSSGMMMNEQPIAAELDQYRCISHFLFRSATTFEGNQHIKDLSKLNRDLARVVVVDDEDVGLKYHPENLVKIKRFEDVHEPDTTLDDLLLFLEDLVVRDVPDVREEIKKYEGRDIPTEFGRLAKQRKIEEEQNRRKGLGGLIRGRR